MGNEKVRSRGIVSKVAKQRYEIRCFYIFKLGWELSLISDRYLLGIEST